MGSSRRTCSDVADMGPSGCNLQMPRLDLLSALTKLLAACSLLPPVDKQALASRWQLMHWLQAGSCTALGAGSFQHGEEKAVSSLRACDTLQQSDA